MVRVGRFEILIPVFLIFSLNCADSPTPRPQLHATRIPSSLSNCRPDYFPLEGGWMGGDVAYSIPLPNGSTLWLFGDTFIGRDVAKTRDGSVMIANSIAISRCEPSGDAQLAYDWRRHRDAPRAVFETNQSGHRFWPQDGFEHNGTLYVTLIEIRVTPEGGALGFEAVRSVLARVENYTEPASQWKIQLTTLVEGKVLMGVSVIKEADHALLFTWVDSQNYFIPSPAVLARIPLDDNHLEYLASDNSWQDGFDSKRAGIVFARGMTEMSVRYHESHRLWLAVMHETKFPSPHILVQTSSSLTGLWSEPRVVYTIPEMTPGNALYDADTFCYASKEHIQYASSGYVTITYACNSFNANKQRDNLNIYVPKVVTVPWSTILANHDKPERSARWLHLAPSNHMPQLRA